MDIEVRGCNNCPFLKVKYVDPIFIELFCSLNSKKLPHNSRNITPKNCDLKKLKKVIIKWVNP